MKNLISKKRTMGHLSILILALLLLQGTVECVEEEDEYLEKCCELGSSWAGQKLRCERFTGPVSGVPRDEQPACLETVDICCRKTFEEQGCELGKTDAKSGRACDSGDADFKGTPVGNYRRDCCEGCKLGILTGSSGKSCAIKKLSLGEPWDSTFKECCNEAKTGTSTTKASTTPIKTTLSSTISTTNLLSEFDDVDDDIDDFTDPNFSDDSNLDLCKLMKGLLCSEICVSTPDSYYCKCNKGSTLQADGRTCKSNITTTTSTTTTTTVAPTTTTKKSTTRSTSSTNVTKANVVTTPKFTTSKIPPKKTTTVKMLKTTAKPKTTTVKPTKKKIFTTTKLTTVKSITTNSTTSKPFKKTTKPLLPASTLRMLSTAAKSRTTRSVSTEDNELQNCPSGYRFNSITETCDDIDECREEPISALCPSGSLCQNTNGTYRCVINQENKTEEQCELGYRWNITKGHCVDVDECLENIHKCITETENCRNLEGSYECEIKCDTGFVFNGIYGACLDINECIEFRNICPQQDTICINTVGSYECKSLREYQQFNDPYHNIGNGSDDRRTADYDGVDEDIDECQVHQQPCAAGEICRNTPGGYDCIPAGCPRGFVLVQDICQDVDECEQGLHSCAPYERCQNTNGSFTCETPRSTRRPTFTERPKIICRKGYKPNYETDSCVDIDECVEGPGCRDFEKCYNIQGSYDCSPLCGSGWYFQLQTKTCQDVDECLLGHHNCRQRTHYCRNTNGSYVCELFTPCSSGYRRSSNGSCIDVDECLEGLHQCSRDSHRYCVNREGGYECITRLPSCSNGFEYSLFTRQCEDIDECRSGRVKCDSRLNETCVNLPGSYRCERPDLRVHRKKPACPAGYSYDIALRMCSINIGINSTTPRK